LTSFSADLRSRDFRKILLIKLSAVGDVVHTIPVLNKLRQRYQSAQLDWLVTPAIAELLRHNTAITNVIEFPREGWRMRRRLALFISYARLAAKLRRTGYDLVVDMHGQLRTAVFTLATGAPVRIGFDRPRARVWDASLREFTVEARKHAWQGAREGSWLAYTHRIPVPDFSFPIPQTAIAAVDALVRRHKLTGVGLVAVAPSTIWETKRWGSERFAEVARHFLRKGFAVAVIGERRERGVCEEVARLAPGAVNTAGETTLTEVAALIRRSTIGVTNDTGLMHLAVALNRPVVSVFGPTDPVWIGPYGRADAVLQAGVLCSPCYLRQLSRCRHGHACMENVSSHAVIERMNSILEMQHSSGPVRVRASVSSSGS
jgi:lipopolysaccharide heptosyltransferase I